MKTRIIAAAVAAAACALSLALPAAAQPVAGAAVEAALKGKTFNTEDFGGKGTISWSADGKISVDIKKPDGSPVVDTGTYRFDGKGYCSTWKKLRTTEKCFTLRKTGDGFEILNPDGSLDSKITAK